MTFCASVSTGVGISVIYTDVTDVMRCLCQ